jgi:uncharacterized protein YkwD
MPLVLALPAFALARARSSTLLLTLLAAQVAAAPITPQARLEAALLEAVQASCPQAHPRFDPALGAATRAFVQAVSAGKAEGTGEALNFYASLAAIDPSPYCGVGSIDQPKQADRAVGDLFPRSCRFEHLGVAAAVVGGKAIVAVLASRRGVHLEPLPGSVEALDVVRFVGKLTDPQLSKPRLYHLKPSGEVDDVPLVATPAGAFALPVRLIETGEHAMELLADGPGGPQVIALRRIFAGVPPPASPPPALPAPKGDGLDAVEHAIAVLRHARGLPALQRDPALDQVAEKHSKEMVRLKTFAHVLPTDGALGDRLQAAGYAYRSAGENIGLAEDAVRAHEAVAQSPAHLWNLLDPRHRRLGLAAVRGMSPEGESAVWLTEVLALPVVGSRDPAADVDKALRAERKKRGLRPIPRNASLDALALREVQRVTVLEAQTLDPLVAQRAIDENPDLHATATELLVAGAPEEVTNSKNLGDPAWTQVGIGAIYASSPRYGPGRLWVLILYAK